ncbi:putative sulfate/molybdate transporter [Natronomonas sp. EA1]|uniref:putative sulfate/molybdate transporter n=1 Tax=Natronomonas sp. EA1 TaxID=3421655 RepID=UPI003EBE69E1
MAVTRVHRKGWAVELSASELLGALGDSVTVLPVVVALAALTEVSLAGALVGFGVFQIVWGLRYGLPVSVEPMKALAGLAIAGTLTYGELVAAGLLAGVVLLGASRLGVVGRIGSLVGRPVVRGVQLAVALLLAQAGLGLAGGDLPLALLGVAVAGLTALVYPKAGALAVLAVGTLLAVDGVPTVALPSLTFFPTAPRFSVAAFDGLLGQLAMTVGNAAVATSLLFSDLYDADVSPDELAGSMGVMNLLAVPFGAIPMCHGSGGLAGKHAFGARTGGANVILGVLYLAAALVAGLWTGFPLAMLGVLLLVVAASLARVALDTDVLALVTGMGVLALATNVGIAFVVGLALHRAAGVLPRLREAGV